MPWRTSTIWISTCRERSLSLNSSSRADHIRSYSVKQLNKPTRIWAAKQSKVSMTEGRTARTLLIVMNRKGKNGLPTTDMTASPKILSTGREWQENKCYKWKMAQHRHNLYFPRLRQIWWTTSTLSTGKNLLNSPSTRACLPFKESRSPVQVKEAFLRRVLSITAMQVKLMPRTSSSKTRGIF